MSACLRCKNKELKHYALWNSRIKNPLLDKVHVRQDSYSIRFASPGDPIDFNGASSRCWDQFLKASGSIFQGVFFFEGSGLDAGGDGKRPLVVTDVQYHIDVLLIFTEDCA